jgi:hypothetical protein
MKPFFCDVILGNSLFFGPDKKYILTDSASGNYGPFFGFGIVGALTSRKISSLAVRDLQGTQQICERINRNYDFQFLMFKIIGRLPEYYKYLKPMFGRTSSGIPGYPKDWISEITGNDPNFR